jgi:hypothetical protein
MAIRVFVLMESQGSYADVDVFLFVFSLSYSASHPKARIQVS